MNFFYHIIIVSAFIQKLFKIQGHVFSIAKEHQIIGRQSCDLRQVINVTWLFAFVWQKILQDVADMQYNCRINKQHNFKTKKVFRYVFL